MKDSPMAFARIEEGTAAGRDFGEDAAGDNVARREVAVRMQSLHEALAFAVDEQRAVAAQGFRCERGRVVADVDGRRMELHEFGIGQQRTRARRNGETDAARFRRIGGHRVEVADAAGSEHDGAGGQGDEPAGGVTRLRAHDRALCNDQFFRRQSFHHMDRWSLAQRHRPALP